MAWRYTRINQLMRAAPWADLRSITEEAVLDILEREPRYKQSTIKFQKGKRATLANIFSLRSIVSTIAHREARLHGDMHPSRAIGGIIDYFFDANLWTEESDETAVETASDFEKLEGFVR